MNSDSRKMHFFIAFSLLSKCVAADMGLSKERST